MFLRANLEHGSDNSQPIFSRMLHRSHLNKGHLTMLLFEKNFEIIPKEALNSVFPVLTFFS